MFKQKKSDNKASFLNIQPKLVDRLEQEACFRELQSQKRLGILAHKMARDK